MRANADQFLAYLDQWYEDLPAESWKSLAQSQPVDHTAIICVDLVNGFTTQGNLSSSRIAGIVPAVTALFRSAHAAGIQNYLLLQDTHPSNSKEFLIYPPHCVEGTIESQTIPELLELPGSERFEILPKKTINPGIEENFRKWLTNHSDVKQFIVVGDCTDICVYLMAIFLKSWQVQEHKQLEVVVPANCVDTYDIPVKNNRQMEVPPHPGDVLHTLFLYHMKLNGVRIVKEIL